MNIQSVLPKIPNITPELMAKLEKLTEVIPDTKVAKNLTQFDKNMFHAYIDAKPFMMGISAKEIAQLNKLDGMDFIYESYNLLSKKLGYSERIRPQLALAELDGQNKMMYTNILNIIYIDPKKTEKMNKTEIFGFIRHELQHYTQNIRILRHEELGPKSIELSAQKYFDTEKQAITQVCTQCSDEDIYKIACSQNPENPQGIYDCLMKAKKCIAENDTEGLDEICKKNTYMYRKQITNFRNTVIEELGFIDKNSSLTPKIESDFKELYDLDYYNEDGTINNISYAQSKIEDEAYNAQGAASFEFSQEPCFIRFAKQDAIASLQDEATLQFVNDVL